MFYACKSYAHMFWDDILKQISMITEKINYTLVSLLFVKLSNYISFF